MHKPKMVGMNHVAIEVGDIEEALAFYGRIFDFTLRGKGKTNAFIDMGDQFINLTQVSTEHRDSPPPFRPRGRRPQRGARTREGSRRRMSTVRSSISSIRGATGRGGRLQRHPVHQGTARDARHGPRAGQDRKARRELADKGMAPDAD